MRAVAYTYTFWPGKGGCFDLEFYYYAYGEGVYKFEVSSVVMNANKSLLKHIIYLRSFDECISL